MNLQGNRFKNQEDPKGTLENNKATEIANASKKTQEILSTERIPRIPLEKIA